MKDLQVAGGWTLPAEKLEEQLQWAIENRHSHSYIQVISLVDQDHFPICTITDLYEYSNPTISVTNDAEFTTHAAWMSAQTKVEFPSIPIIYCDTEGNWDQLLHNEGHFVGFRTLQTKDLDTALILTHRNWLKDNFLAADH